MHIRTLDSYLGRLSLTHGKQTLVEAFDEALLELAAEPLELCLLLLAERAECVRERVERLLCLRARLGAGAGTLAGNLLEEIAGAVGEL